MQGELTLYMGQKEGYVSRKKESASKGGTLTLCQA
jgi:hypothetical protein